MQSKRFLFLVFFLVLSSLSSNLNAQRYINASAGYSVGSLFDFRKNDYNYSSDYKIKSGYFVSLSFDSLRKHQNVRFRLQFGNQNLVLESSSGSHFGPTYSNYDLQFQYSQIDFDYIFRLIQDKMTSFNLYFGPTFSYNLRTVLNGNGGSPKQNSFTDSLGQNYYWFTTSEWERKNEISTAFSGFNFGLNVGLSVCYPIKDKLDLVLENRYSLFFYQITNMELELGSFLRGDLSLGLRFKL